jgi:hypothetical protein
VNVTLQVRNITLHESRGLILFASSNLHSSIVPAHARFVTKQSSDCFLSYWENKVSWCYLQLHHARSIAVLQYQSNKWYLIKISTIPAISPSLQFWHILHGILHRFCQVAKHVPFTKESKASYHFLPMFVPVQEITMYMGVSIILYYSHLMILITTERPLMFLFVLNMIAAVTNDSSFRCKSL